MSHAKAFHLEMGDIDIADLVEKFKVRGLVVKFDDREWTEAPLRPHDEDEEWTAFDRAVYFVDGSEFHWVGSDVIRAYPIIKENGRVVEAGEPKPLFGFLWS